MNQRATIFGSEAAAYDRFRPSYPTDVVDMIVAGQPRLAVDAGCGTGIAARQVAGRGVDVIGVEADADMAAIARGHGVDVVVTPFEDWDPVECDVVYAAQSWHWIDPQVGARIAADAIGPGGRWIGFWNLEVDEELDRACRSVYEQHAPELVDDQPTTHLRGERFWTNIEDGLRATGYFERFDHEVIRWIDVVESEHFVDRLGTHSALRMLTDDRRNTVRSALVETLGRDATVEVDYATEVFTAHRT